MFLLKANGEKWWISEVSVLQGNRRQFIQYLTLCLKTHCSFSVFISAPFAHEFHSLTHSEQHTVGKDTYSIIHWALNFISFPLSFFKRTLCTHPHSVPHRHTKCKSTHVYCCSSNWEVKHNNSNTHTNMLWNKILKSVTDTWSNAHLIPKGTHHE